MLTDWRFWAAAGTALLLVGLLQPLVVPPSMSPALRLLVVAVLLLTGYELGKRIIP